MEVKRFFFVSVGGFLVDIGIAYGVASLLGAPLWCAAVVGFTIAAVVNYFLHEVWTFRHQKVPSLSFKRALYYFISSSLMIALRLAVVAWLSTLLSTDYKLSILICGAAISFCVNYMISKFLVFSKRTMPKENFDARNNSIGKR